MTYNLSLSTIDRWKEELDKLLENRVVLFSTDKPNKLAYSLREAIAAAKKHKVGPYNKLEYWFREREGLLVAEPRKERLRIIDVEVINKEFGTDLKPPDLIDEVPEARSMFEVIEAVKHSKSAIIRFENYQGDLTPLESWGNAKGWAVTEDPVTFTRRKES